MFHMASESHIASLATSLLHSGCEADLALVTESGVSMAHSALLLPLLPDLASLISSCSSCSPHDPIVLLLPETSTPPLISALESVYMQGDPAALADVFGLGLQETSLIKENTIKGDVRDIFEDIESSSDSSCTLCGKHFTSRYHKCDSASLDEEDEKPNNIDQRLNSEKQNEISPVEGIVPFSCRETLRCKRTYLTERSLRNHILNYHEGEKKHSCNVCLKRFHRKARLKKHTMVHEKKAIICPMCGQRQRDLYRLKVHHQQLHVAEGSNCHRCDKTFANRRDLRIHNKSCGRKQSRALLRLKQEGPKAVLPKVESSDFDKS